MRTSTQSAMNSNIASPVGALTGGGGVQSPATPHLSLHSPQLQDPTHSMSDSQMQMQDNGGSMTLQQAQQLQALQLQSMALQQSPQTSNGASVDDQLQQACGSGQQQMQSSDQTSQSSTPSNQQTPAPGYFTIEQIELVRRLRNSGLSINQFMEAYKEMDRLDRELTFDKSELMNDNAANSITNALNSMALPNQSYSSPYSSISNQSGVYFNYQNNQNHYIQPGQAHHLQPFGDDVSAQELLEFKKKGEPAMMMEIRNFVSKYNIRQQMIAEMTHISQGYISTFFHGEKMSEKRKNIIYQWYLTYSKDPSRLVRDHASMTMANHSHSMISKYEGDTNSDGQDSGLLFPITRRDRFIFRKQHLKILEHYFKENPYPEIHAKEQIVEECNSQAERIAGKSLKESDKVTVAIVSNWFNNRRKNVRSRQVKQLTQAANGLGLSSINMQQLIQPQQVMDQTNMGVNQMNTNMSVQAIAASTSAYLQGNGSQQVNASNNYALGNQQINSVNQNQTSHAHLQHQQSDASFDTTYGYDCSYSNESTPPTVGPSNAGGTPPMQMVRNNGSNSGSNLQFKTEPYDQFLECFQKMQGNVCVKQDRDAEVDSLQHEESSISEFSSQASIEASFNGDSID